MRGTLTWRAAYSVDKLPLLESATVLQEWVAAEGSPEARLDTRRWLLKQILEPAQVIEAT